MSLKSSEWPHEIYDVEPKGKSGSAVVLLPVPFAATVSYGTGAENGPRAIHQASVQVDLEDYEVGDPSTAGIHLLPIDPEIERLHAEAKGSSDVALVNRASETLNARVFAEVSSLLAQNKIVGTIGGDHASVFGAIRAHAEHFGDIGVLQFDAHADLRNAYQGYTYSHASVMRCVLDEVPGVRRLVQVAIRDFCREERELIQSSPDRISTFFDVDLARARMEGRLLEVAKEIAEALPDKVYVSFDIDGLDPKLCPNTGTPVPGGLEMNEAFQIIRAVVESGRTIVGFDLNEVAPGEDEWDANVGARVLYKLIGWAVSSRSKSASV